jgi:hypothetical protein
LTEIITRKLKPLWEEIDSARTLCFTNLEKKNFDIDVIDAIAMISSELLENAIKYGNFTVDNNEIDFKVYINHEIIVEVQCPVNIEESHHFDRLDRTIQWIRGHQDPFEAYIEKLKSVSSKPLGDNESGLGLFRIAYEGEAVLDFYVDESSFISVSAVYRI